MPRMAKRVKRYGRRRNVKYRRPTRRSRTGSIVSRIKRMVQRVMAPEAKYISTNVVDAAFNSTISAPAECYPLVPPVTVGAGDYQRIGSRVKPKYLEVKVKLQYIGPSVRNSIDQMFPCTVRVMMLEQRDVKRTDLLAANLKPQLLLDDRVGTSVPRPYTGGQFDNLAPVNTNLFRVLSDTLHRFNWDYYGNFGTAGAAAGNNLTQYIHVKIKCPAHLEWDDGSPNPTNFAPFICLGYVYDNAEGADTLDTKIWATAQSTLHFTDM